MNTLATVCASEFILLDHHPDLFRRPEAKPNLIEAENRRVALTWNVFRTLELIAPEFWLRRFRARLDALTSLEPGNRSVSIRLWAVLSPLPDQLRQDPVCIDALIETETAVYGLITYHKSDVEVGDSTLVRPDAVLRVIDAVSWYAGARDCYVALIASDWADTPLGGALIERYRGSRDGMLRRLPHRRDGLVNVRNIGGMTWRDVAAIVHDCADSDSLNDLERLQRAERCNGWTR